MKALQDLISQMTLEEKASLSSGRDFWHLKGIPRLGIPSIMITDGPHGLRAGEGDPTQIGLTEPAPATCFPTASALAATWNRELIYEIGQALAEECKEQGVSVILGPGANIKRSPLCGRNFEYFSEDPILSGEIAKSHINGVQSLGIGSSLKHYAVNNQEFRRMTINALVDERALREIYLAGFEIAVTGAQPWTVMGAYNQVNGTYACEHPLLLGKILREEWGHQGLAISDWGAMNQRLEALVAGLAVEMPGPSPENDAMIVAAVQEGRLEESILDQVVQKILDLIFKTQGALGVDYKFDREAHHALARKAAGEGAVLLKNQGQILPLSKDTRVALIGEMARTPRYQGAGSSRVNPFQVESILAEMTKMAGIRINFAPGYRLNDLEADQELIEEALATAGDADVVVICAGLPENFEVEGLDRDHIALPENQDRLIEALAAEYDQVVVVLSNGSPVEMPWIDRVQAVLEGYLGGQAGGGAVADILFGETNPSGKLAETFPLRLEDTPCHRYFPGGPRTVEYRESLYVGYRFYDSVDKEVLFPFGHGLSYTTFDYCNLTLNTSQISDSESLEVSLKVKNTGSVAGKEIIQLYICPTAPQAFRPEKELKAFAKVQLQSGEEKDVSFELDRRAFAYYNTDLKDWQVETGEYQILVGASSRDIRCQAVVQIESSQAGLVVPDRDHHPTYLKFPVDAKVNRADFESLLGSPLPANLPERKGEYTINTPVGDLSESLIGSQLINFLEKQVEDITKDDPDSPNALMIRASVKGLPLRAIAKMGGERVTPGMIEGLLAMVNGRFIKGLITILRARRNINRSFN
jgi:beta-glucosidase